jgi:hypothetical protein
VSFVAPLLLAAHLASSGLSLPTSEARLEPVQYRVERNGNLTGTGDNFGRGYRVERGNSGRSTTYSGTGRNFGSGYRADQSSGGRSTTYRGTGQNFGSGYRQEGNRITGTGNNFGAGWERSSDGSWRGTGRNWGRKCGAGSSPVGC